MAFPLDEDGIIAKAVAQISGLPAVNAFTDAPFNAAAIKAMLDAFVLKNEVIAATQATLGILFDEKADLKSTLIKGLKKNDDYFELTSDNEIQLATVGVEPSSLSSAPQVPGQPRNTEIIKQGSNWLFLDWKKPSGGGKVAFYKILRRQLPAGTWEDAGSAIETEKRLDNQPTAKELEYCVVAVNTIGESQPDTTVSAVL